jgi:cytochrome c oxidase subunit 2
MRRPFDIPFLLACAALAGCHQPQNYLTPAGPAARRLANLGVPTLILFCVITGLMWLLVLVVALRRRGTLDTRDTREAPGGKRWILFGGFIFPAVVLTGLFIGMLHVLNNFPMDAASCKLPTIKVVGHQWWFEAHYMEPGHPDLTVVSPTEVHIPVGQPVDIELVTRDVIHSFWLPKLHGKVDLIPGQENHVRLTADAPGVYQGECAEYCGPEHANMRVQVVAEERDRFDAWLTHQRSEAATPTNAQALHGRDVFMSGPCATCHTIRGTAALGAIGPELTHVASRRRIAGGMLENNTANLEAWVTHAQSLKPDAKMPDLPEFNGDDLRALVAYLQSLQ